MGLSACCWERKIDELTMCCGNNAWAHWPKGERGEGREKFPGEMCGDRETEISYFPSYPQASRTACNL